MKTAVGTLKIVAWERSDRYLQTRARKGSSRISHVSIRRRYIRPVLKIGVRSQESEVRSQKSGERFSLWVLWALDHGCLLQKSIETNRQIGFHLCSSVFICVAFGKSLSRLHLWFQILNIASFRHDLEFGRGTIPIMPYPRWGTTPSIACKSANYLCYFWSGAATVDYCIS